MNKFWRLLFNSFKTDFKLLNINQTKNKFLNNILLPLIIIISLFYSVGFYAYEVASVLAPLNLTYILISIWLILIFVFIVFETSYKAQSYLFEGKDNDLLLSLPVPKRYILLVRIIKLFVFEMLFACLFLLPAIAVYAYFEHPALGFYLIALLMITTEAIIPTVIGSFIAYLIKSISSHFKSKKLIQIFLSLLLTFLIFYFSFNMNSLSEGLKTNATNINQIISNIYYPITLLQQMISNFKLIALLKYLGLNIAVLGVFIYLMSINYYKIIQKSNDNIVNSKNKHFNYQVNKPSMALIKREFKRFYSSPVYILNTLFGLILILIMAICLLFKPDLIINLIMQNDVSLSYDDIISNLPKIYLIILVFSICLCSITSSAISLEGKYFNSLKCFPISIKNILLAYLKTSLVIVYPFVFISDLLLFKYLSADILEYIIIILISIILPILIGILGLLINLKYPKLAFKSDTEVVKQSMSTMIAIYAGMAIAGVLIISSVLLMDKFNFYLIQFSLLTIISLLTILLYYLLINQGIKLFSKINN
jgi:ABC-2 type transport system permease protein